MCACPDGLVCLHEGPSTDGTLPAVGHSASHLLGGCHFWSPVGNTQITHSLLTFSSVACLLQADAAEAGSTLHPKAGAGCMQKAGQGGHLVTSLGGGDRAGDWGTSLGLGAVARQD